MAKLIKFDEDARVAIKRGIDQLAKAVTMTLGPRGRAVVIEKGYGAPQVTFDGVTVAKEIELEDKWENLGAEFIKQAMQDIDLGLVRVLGGEPRRRALEDFPHRIELEHLLLGQLSDDQAAAGADRQQSALLQPLERFPYRRPAHAQRSRDLLLRNPLAGGEASLPDRVTQAGEDEFAAGLPA